MPLDLGYLGKRGAWHFWLFERNEDNWMVPEKLPWTELLGEEVSTGERFWRSLDLLEKQRLVSRVVTMQDGRYSYPLWLSAQEHRAGLMDNFGLIADLTRSFSRAARSFQVDVAWDLLEARLSDPDAPETGLFICATKREGRPTVRTLYTPRFHAPTTTNLGGLLELAKHTSLMTKELDATRRLTLVA